MRPRGPVLAGLVAACCLAPPCAAHAAPAPPVRLRLAGFGEAPGTPFAPGAPGWSLHLRAVSREAVPGETETAALLLREPHHGWGFFVSWARIWNETIASPFAVVAGPVLAADGWRLAGRWSRWSWGRRGSTLLEAAVHRRVGRNVAAGGRLALAPAGEAGAGEEGAIEGIVAEPPWWGAVRLGPDPGAWELVLGVEARPGIFCDLAVDDEAVEIGVRWALGPVELAAREEDHGLLGRVSRVGLTLGEGER